MKKSKKLLKKLYRTAVLVIILIISLELGLQVAVALKVIPYFGPFENFYYSFNIVPYFTKPCSMIDSVSGFRWLQRNAVAFKVCRGKTVFYNQVKPNNWGFISPSEASVAKPDKKVFRWIVFGDSFTDGYFLARNWPAAVQERFRQMGNDSVELHSFALNGSGIYTWHRVFLWLNQIGYAYDGVIIACFGNDLSRKFFVMDHTDNLCRWDWVDSLHGYTLKNKAPLILNGERAALAEQFRMKRYAPVMWRLYTPYFLRVLTNDLLLRRRLRSEMQRQYNLYIAGKQTEQVSWESMRKKYGDTQMHKLKEMLEWCRQTNTPLLLASVPEAKGAQQYKQGSPLSLNEELKMLADTYHFVFFNGYSIFDTIHPDAIMQYFLPYDGHWNQNASDMFAEKIFHYLAAYNLFPFSDEKEKLPRHSDEAHRDSLNRKGQE
ncbi:MAG: hypothetical protein KatS3mg031_2006 [Chitinophagales bacterium]|nr:MAG: hypothetical protein KatS3mg031_2006 [Chitinophagales bacterium]